MKKPFADNKKMKSICRKCSHRSTCKTPCSPVKEYLVFENRQVYEKSFTNSEGQQISIIYSRPREINFSAFKREGDTDKNRQNKIEQAFSTENESAFSHFSPTLKQTRLFINKFFHKMSIEDLAVKYQMTPEAIYVYYEQAKRRLFDVLEALDSKKRLKLDHVWKQIEARSGLLPKGQRYFLMSKVFELTPTQIAEIEGLKNAASVSILIHRVSDQLRAGEIELFPFTKEESIQAKQRLDRVRERRRKHRAKNLEQVRGYDRERYARK